LDPQTRVQVGDRLVTGPFRGSTYAPGIPVGEVSAVTGDPTTPAQDASLRPYVAFTALDLVGIVLSVARTDPRDSVLPAAPTLSPSPSPTAPTATASTSTVPPGTPRAGASQTP